MSGQVSRAERGSECLWYHNVFVYFLPLQEGGDKSLTLMSPLCIWKLNTTLEPFQIRCDISFYYRNITWEITSKLLCPKSKSFVCCFAIYPTEVAPACKTVQISQRNGTKRTETTRPYSVECNVEILH